MQHYMFTWTRSVTPYENRSFGSASSNGKLIGTSVLIDKGIILKIINILFPS